MITATGNRMPLLKTTSHNTVSESIASLTFFSPHSFHTLSIWLLHLQIIQSSCKGSDSYELLRLLLFCFVFFACWVSSLLRCGSSFSTECKPQLHWCNCVIPEIVALSLILKRRLNYYSTHRWVQSMRDIKEKVSISSYSSSPSMIRMSSTAATFIRNASTLRWCSVSRKSVCSYFVEEKKRYTPSLSSSFDT